MKRLIVGIMLVGMVLTSCEEAAPGIEIEGCIEVKMISNICGNAVLQVLNPDFHEIETVDWADQNNTYENVIYTLLSCSTDEAYYEQGAIFKIRISQEPTAENELCIRCAATFANPPSVYYHTQIVEDCDELRD